MKKNLIFVTVTLFAGILFIMTGCGGGGGGSNVSDKGVLGKLPAVVDEYSKKIDEIDIKLKEVKDIDKAMKLSLEQQELKKEIVTKLEESFTAMGGKIDAPFEQTGDMSTFLIKKCYISGVHSGNHAIYTLDYEVLADFPNANWAPWFEGKLVNDKGEQVNKSILWSPQNATNAVKKGEMNLKNISGHPIKPEDGNAVKIIIAVKPQ